jgi:hypothetical protein
VFVFVRRAGDLFGQRNILLKAKAVLTRGLAGVDNVYTQVCARRLELQAAAATHISFAFSSTRLCIAFYPTVLYNWNVCAELACVVQLLVACIGCIPAARGQNPTQ